VYGMVTDIKEFCMSGQKASDSFDLIVYVGLLQESRSC